MCSSSAQSNPTTLWLFFTLSSSSRYNDHAARRRASMSHFGGVPNQTARMASEHGRRTIHSH